MSLHQFLLPMLTGMFAGLLTRVLLIQTSYRQFPSRPHGMVIHVFLGFVAGLLGALIVPAVFKPDFTAGVFISIGTAQFHTVRSLERDAWREIDKGEPVPRGPAYIEGLAITFESRIFLVVAVSAVTTLISFTFHPPAGLICGVIAAFLMRLWKQGKSVGDLARVESAKVDVRDNHFYINEMCVGPAPDGLRDTPSDLLVLVVQPRDFSGILTLSHEGQQQTVLHNLAIAVGVQKHPEFKPTSAYYPKDKKLVLMILPLIYDEQLGVEAVAGAPILEAVIRKPIHT